MEDTSDRVMSGKIIHEDSYQRKKNKEMLIDNILRLDIVDNEYIREIKISSKMSKADEMQLLYYIFYLKQLGINKKGTINYVKEKRVDTIELTKEKEEEIKQTLVNIKSIENKKSPPKLEKLPYCKKCAYYNFCYAKEEK